MRQIAGLFYAIFAFLTSQIGFAIHKSLFWAVVDFFFSPLAWAKWIIYKEVSLSIIKSTFEWFFK